MRLWRAWPARQMLLEALLYCLAVFVSIGLVIIAMQITDYLDGVGHYASATPTGVARYLKNHYLDVEWWRPIGLTMYLVGKGLGVGVVASCVCAAVMGLWPDGAKWLVALLAGFRAIPLTLLWPFVTLLPVMLWVYPPGMSHGPNEDPAWLVAIGSFLYMIIGFAEGAALRNREREVLFKKVYGFSRRQYLWRILLRESLLQVLPAFRIAAIFALVLAIVLEQIIAYDGVGRRVGESLAGATYTNDKAAEAVGFLFVVAVMGAAIDGACVLLRRFFLRWQRPSSPKDMKAFG